MFSCSKKHRWQYSYKIEQTVPGTQVLERAEIYRRRQSYSTNILICPPKVISYYPSPIKPPVSRYSRPGGMDPSIIYERRMKYSTSLSVQHAESLRSLGTAKSPINLAKEQRPPTCEPHIHPSYSRPERQTCVNSHPNEHQRPHKLLQSELTSIKQHPRPATCPSRARPPETLLQRCPRSSNIVQGPNVAVQRTCPYEREREYMSSGSNETEASIPASSGYASSQNHVSETFPILPRPNVLEILRQARASLRNWPCITDHPPILKITPLRVTGYITKQQSAT